MNRRPLSRVLRSLEEDDKSTNLACLDLIDVNSSVGCIFIKLPNCDQVDSENAVKRLVTEIQICEGILEANHCTTIKSIQNVLMAISGLPHQSNSYLDDLAKAAISIKKRIPHTTMGMHLGPAFATIIGRDQITYDVFGDTPNTASRMLTSSPPNGIHCSESVVSELRSNFFFSPLQLTQCKGKGLLTTALLLTEQSCVEFDAEEEVSLLSSDKLGFSV
eukprot:NODE_2494_length_916_cov_95.213379_g2049_i0.p1 GENE.NODE_2494_length_916_cov_95.213379_g2049_i0~~NODE_2494_length_916_cov_95.213379_g2049_i0.p1  ORF type:complete len:219 (+),score=28.78 NODE_2494_length_916_cov_95.213379_g2049_i0:183-839(+)